MNSDRLDQAIDQVAARLTRVDDDPGFASRIAEALPERRSRVRWLIAPALAGLAAFVLAVIQTNVPDRPPASIPESVPAAIRKDVQAMVQTAVPEKLPSNVRRRARSNDGTNIRATDRSSDHEFSLAPIDRPGDLVIGSVAPRSLVPELPLNVEPLEIADLPVTSELFSPR
jgi:hypothetical protein